MKYKASRYNLVVLEKNDSIYLYNTYSGSFIKIERIIYNQLSQIAFDKQDIKYFDNLFAEGFIVPKEYDEFNKICFESKKDSYGDSPELSFVIAPTLMCNLHCEYCFEKNTHTTVMDGETQKAVVKYILSKITNNTKKIKVSWFGGEPLLTLDVVRNISRLLSTKLQNKKIDYVPFLITNGTLLNNENCKILYEDCNLRNIQITIDGESQTYCKTKKATSKQYQELIDNIVNGSKYFNISIRLNVTKENFDELKNIAKYLSNLCDSKNKIKFYLARVVDYSNTMEGKCLTLNEYLEKKLEFDSYMKKNISDIYEFEIPKYRKNYCGALRHNNVVIGPKGELYKCEHLIGEENETIGTVFNGINFNDSYIKFIQNDFKEECKECILFPKCLGGCPIQRCSLPKTEYCHINLQYLLQCLIKKV